MSFWMVVTRFGEAQILLPALLTVALWLALRSNASHTAARWLMLVAAAAAITTVTKVAFLGFGIGVAALDFTGISGHAMFATAALPLIAHAVSVGHSDAWRRRALAATYAFALVIAVSRVVIGVHSPSEVVAGCALGALASGAALAGVGAPQRPVPKTLLVALFTWLLAGPAGAPPSPTHGWVVRLSLAVSGRSEPYTRAMLHAAGQAKTSTSPGASSTTVTPRRSS
jgi:membrane-associated phospholipid phosphatase